MPKIHLLDKDVYEIIAAGEVVERPAAAVKELVENSLDAGATKLQIEIKNGGRTYIRVTDNGCGMSAEDVPIAFVRHATSKVSKREDLDRIHTLGFRGEALASVCAVSKVEVFTKTADAPEGYHYQIEDGNVIDSGAIGCSNGTTFIVKDIFYNTPARQKFLKRDVSEGNYISNILQKLALSHPHVSFKFIRDNKLEFVTPGDGELLSCIYVILGEDFYKNCIPVDYTYLGIRVTGYVTKPLCSFASRANQIFFVNSRYIKSTICNFAFEDAFKGKMMVSKYPGCVLNIEINPEYVDVNCHPAKTEVRFRDDPIMHNVIMFAVNNSLMRYDTPAEMKLTQAKEKTYTFKDVYAEPAAETNEAHMQLGTKGLLTEVNDELEPQISEIKAVLNCGPDESDNKSFPSSGVYSGKNESGSSAPDSVKTEESDFTDGYRYINSQSVSGPAKSDSKKKKPVGRPPVNVLGEAFKTYIIAECGGDIIFIDKHAAHERYIFEQIKSQQTTLESQMLIQPHKTRVSEVIYESVAENLDFWRRLGIVIEPLPSSFLSISSIPAIAEGLNPDEIIERIGMASVNKDNPLGQHIFDDIYSSIACKAAIKARSNSDMLELEKIIDLVTEDDLRYCPHGRPILIKLSEKEIKKMFKRIT